MICKNTGNADGSRSNSNQHEFKINCMKDATTEWVLRKGGILLYELLPQVAIVVVQNGGWWLTIRWLNFKVRTAVP